ncbi:GNAT family N-acetyltransferase [Anaerosacchariphilus polymeriproducens]|uniref:N-acetyltransferase n=1 Tax=Anaerosacchariphilus polymeriproducens TaxID=1812858 RepID=A0A371AVA9_9FIRM|nr:GNAT family protein [Anaerosacchariphilus polymeriproducens]RDU23479.1 N-acetyltransferase [Anaerosacchariphilus polymeriproducens]
MNLIYETNRLYLSVLNEKYASNVLDFYLNDKELFEKYEPQRTLNFYTRTYQKANLNFEYQLFIKSASIRFWVFEKTQPEKIIGSISFLNIQRNAFQSCQLGYKFASAFHHRGYATEALKKGIDIIFSELGLHRIEAFVLPENLPSKKVLERLDFAFEGTCKDYAFLQGEWRTHERFALCNF